MVAETKETMAKMFDCWSDGLRAALDAGRRAQETWVKTMTDASTDPSGSDSLFATSEKMAREFAPFVGKNLETAAKTCDTAFHANMDAFKAATDVAAHPDDGDFYKRSRRVADAAFDAFRTNVDAMTKGAARSAEACSAFSQVVCVCPGGKSASKSGGKAGA